MYALIVMLLANVGGFVLYSKDVSRFDELIKVRMLQQDFFPIDFFQTPELSWLAARGGTLFLFGEPEEKSEFVNGRYSQQTNKRHFVSRNDSIRSNFLDVHATGRIFDLTCYACSQADIVGMTGR